MMMLETGVNQQHAVNAKQYPTQQRSFKTMHDELGNVRKAPFGLAEIKQTKGKQCCADKHSHAD